MPTPPMLRPPDHRARPLRPDPLASLTVGALWLIAGALLVAAVLATYTYSTPGAELPLVIGIVLMFVALLAVNLARVWVRHLRARH